MVKYNTLNLFPHKETLLNLRYDVPRKFYLMRGASDSVTDLFQIPQTPRMSPIWNCKVITIARKAKLNIGWLLSTQHCNRFLQIYITNHFNLTLNYTVRVADCCKH